MHIILCYYVSIKGEQITIYDTSIKTSKNRLFYQIYFTNKSNF